MLSAGRDVVPARRFDVSSAAGDICIIGGGTVGLLAAHVLAGHGRRVTVLEAGQPHADHLRSTVRQISGRPHNGRTGARGFGLGGTSQLWGGQLSAWAPGEISERPHLGLPAWPIDYTRDLQRAYRAVAALLPLTSAQRALLSGGPDEGGLQEVSVRRSTWLSWRSRNFARVFPGTEGPHAFSVLTGTLVQELQVSDGVCTGVRYLDDGGRPHVVSADEVLVAAGTLGNAAVLSTLPDENEWLGRGFMDHLTAVVGRFEITDRRKFRRSRPFSFVRGARFSTRFLAPPEFAEQRGLPFGFAHIELDRPTELVALRAMMRARQSGARWSEIRSLLPDLLRGLPSVLAMAVCPHLTGREFIARKTALRLMVDVEQLPSADNFLAAQGGRVDMHWRHTAGDTDAIKQYTKYFVEDVDWSALGLALTEVGMPEPTDDFHMMGGTRMADDPGFGVVDARGRVFGYRNLRVAGASVFPTGAIANPTFTACALAWLAVEDMISGPAGEDRDPSSDRPLRVEHPTGTGAQR
jgi:choline dehydrogenase-like flavoprotein